MDGIDFCITLLTNMGTALEVLPHPPPPTAGPQFFALTDNFLTWEMLLITLPYSGNLDLSEKCFQDLILKDQNHPAALINYAALLLCKHGSVVAGMLSKSLTSFWDKLY